MEDFKVRCCRLCLTTINGENYEAIEDVTKEILDVLFLNLDLDDYGQHVMCNVCPPKLHAALKFKSTCLYTDNTIVSYVDDAAVLPIDLREIYIKERKNIGITDDVKICRVCMQQIENVSELKSINEEQADMIQKFVPEVNVFIIKEPVMCKLCQDLLAVHFNFLKKCSDAIKNVENICSEKIQETPSLDTSVKIEDVDMDFEDIEHSVEIESLDIKDEEIENERGGYGGEIYSQSRACLKPRTQGCKFSVCDYKINRTLYKCATCRYKTKNKDNLRKHMLTHKSSSEKQKHKEPSEMQIYKCGTCNYESKVKGSLKTHMLIHKDPLEVKMYRCETCSYETSRKENLKRHMLVHKDPSEVPMYKCETCNYKTKYNSSLKTHITSIHKDPSEVQMYKCGTCNYESNVKGGVKKHMLIHKDPSEVKMYKCEACSFETTRKEHVARHMLVHKDPSEVQMYKCENCKYESKFKGSLKKHMLIHKDPSEVQMYKCETCNYKTKYKSDLKTHIMLIHKDPSEVQMYKCKTCKYESKVKGSVKKHMWKCRNVKLVVMKPVISHTLTDTC